MNRFLVLSSLCAGLLACGSAHSQRLASGGDDSVAQIPQTAAGTPWSFIGFGITTPADPQWFVANSTPRTGTMGRTLSASPPNAATLAISSELLEQPLDTDTALLAAAKSRHARIGERWEVSRHDETIERLAGTRCARHAIAARAPEDRSPRKDAGKSNAARPFLNVIGLSCVHPTEPRLLVEVGVSERGPNEAMSPAVARDARQVIDSLSFQRYSEQALQKSAEFARAGEVKDAEAMLKPYIDADAAWARFFLAQILQRAMPPPPDAGPRMKGLLEPAAERGLADAQWMLGTLLLRGAPGVPKDTPLGEALLRRAAERGNPGAALQLGLALLSSTDGLPPDRREAVLWISRSAARGQKEAQDLLESARESRTPAPAR
jgi:hypothetical protein